MEVTVIENGNQILDEIREFHLEIKTRLHQHNQEFILLQRTLVKMETELRELKSVLKVVAKKASEVDILETRIKVLLEKNELVGTNLEARNLTEKSESEQRSKIQTVSFANIVKESKAEVVSSFVPTKNCGHEICER